MKPKPHETVIGCASKELMFKNIEKYLPYYDVVEVFIDGSKRKYKYCVRVRAEYRR